MMQILKPDTDNIENAGKDRREIFPNLLSFRFVFFDKVDG